MIGQHCQSLRFLVVKDVNDGNAAENPEFARVELPCLAQQLAQDLVAHRARRLDFATPAAGRARFAQHMRERFACTLARHFHQDVLAIYRACL